MPLHRSAVLHVSSCVFALLVVRRPTLLASAVLPVAVVVREGEIERQRVSDRDKDVERQRDIYIPKTSRTCSSAEERRGVMSGGAADPPPH